MTSFTLRFALALSLSTAASASTINFSTNAPSGSCFSNVYNSASDGCAGSGVTTTVTNAQGDSASIVWTGVTNSINFNSGPTQPVNFGSFAVTYTSNAGDTTPVIISPVTFLLIVKEFSPVTIFYQPVLVNFSGTQSSAGQVGPASADLEAIFSPTTVGNGVDTTFLVPSSADILNYGPTNNIAGQVQFNSVTSTPEPSSWILLAAGLPLLFIKKFSAAVMRSRSPRQS